MEWNALHAPLEPPKGYEQFHTLEAVCPGYADLVWPKSFEHAKELLIGGWRIFKHSHGYHDPEVAEWFRKAEERDNKIAEKRAEHVAKQVGEGLVRGKERLEEIGDTVTHVAQEAKPGAESFFKDRAVVLQKAVSEFAAGFHETVSGKKNIWGADPGIDEDIETLVRNDPVVYRVQPKTDDV